jgi:hypothetical protein
LTSLRIVVFDQATQHSFFGRADFQNRHGEQRVSGTMTESWQRSTTNTCTSINCLR